MMMVVMLVLLSGTCWSLSWPRLYKKLTDPFVLIRLVGQFINDWSILQQKQENQEELRWAVKLV